MPPAGVAGRVHLVRTVKGAACAFVAHQEGLVRLAFLLSGSHAQAEDAVAEVFARSWGALDAGRVEHPGAYLRRGVVNELRRQGRRRIFERVEVRPNGRIEEGFDTAVVARDRMMTVLRSLPRRQREVLVLRFWEDRSVAETADLLGMSAGSVKTHSHRGLEAIRRQVEDR